MGQDPGPIASEDRLSVSPPAVLGGISCPDPDCASGPRLGNVGCGCPGGSAGETEVLSGGGLGVSSGGPGIRRSACPLGETEEGWSQVLGPRPHTGVTGRLPRRAAPVNTRMNRGSPGPAPWQPGLCGLMDGEPCVPGRGAPSKVWTSQSRSQACERAASQAGKPPCPDPHAGVRDLPRAPSCPGLPCGTGPHAGASGRPETILAVIWASTALWVPSRGSTSPGKRAPSHLECPL